MATSLDNVYGMSEQQAVEMPSEKYLAMKGLEYGIGGSQDAAKAVAPIDTCLNRLGSSVSTLDKLGESLESTINRLELKLGSVMSPPFGKAAGAAPTAGVRPAAGASDLSMLLSQVDDSLQSLLPSFDRQISRIDELIARLEI